MKKDKNLTIKVLKYIGIASTLLAASVLSPQFPYLALQNFLKQKYHKKYNRLQLGNTVEYLKRKKFITYKNNGITLTNAGSHYLEEISLIDHLSTKALWDNKWRIISFDIPEQHRRSRQKFRRKLTELGFFNLHKSVFIFPYPCSAIIYRCLEFFKITENVFLWEADRFHGDQKLINHFKLRH